MLKLKTWISAARLRTLPLSISGILTGTGIALQNNFFDPVIFSLALATTLGLQVLSNFANDYGDGVKGTDNEDRIGPTRALQSGIISDTQMKKAIILTAIITTALSILLIYVAFGTQNFGYSILFLFLGIAAIAAAIKYTVGKSAYGYRGLGDVFVFLFFGLLSVIGTYFLYSKQLKGQIVLPATAIGLLSTAVLNLNNMRDRLSDQKSKKITLAVKLGKETAKKYHYTLIVIALGAMCSYCLFFAVPLVWGCLLAFIPLTIHLKTVYQNKNPQLLDNELKKVALSTFLLAILFLALSIW